jgi:predicted ATPase
LKSLKGRHFLEAIELLRSGVPSFDAYPYCLPAVAGLGILPMHPNVTFLVGENGSGKSTLLEAVAILLRLNAEGGSGNFAFKTRESHSRLCDHLRLRRTLRRPRDSWFLRAESYFNVATEIERLDEEPAGGPPIISSYGGKSLHEQSHGESFFALFRNRFRGEGLYLLDEPEAALSPMRQMAFLTILDGLVKKGSQFVIATHSPIILAYPKAWIYVLGGANIERTAYEETEHYRVSRQFLLDPARMMKELTGDGAVWAGDPGAEPDVAANPGSATE